MEKVRPLLKGKIWTLNKNDDEVLGILLNTAPVVVAAYGSGPITFSGNTNVAMTKLMKLCQSE